VAGFQSGHPVPASLQVLPCFYGRPGTRLVLFDNERGKGDHKHIREVESAYEFESIERLMEDFMQAVRACQAGEI
jgi:hypothetical protein